MDGKTKSGGTKGKNDDDRFTLRIASGNCWRARRSRLLSKSTWALIPFEVLQFFSDFTLSESQQAWTRQNVQTTPHRTHVHAHFSRVARVAEDCQVLRVSQNHSISDRVSFGCSVSSVSSDFLFTDQFSDATFRIINTTDWNQKNPLCHSAVGWKCLAICPIWTPDTGHEPKLCIEVSNEHTPINGNRNFPHDDDATIATTEDLDLPRHSGTSSSKHTAAASGAPTMSKLGSLGKSLTIVLAESS